jgi:hypothetical protein
MYCNTNHAAYYFALIGFLLLRGENRFTVLYSIETYIHHYGILYKQIPDWFLVPVFAA